MFDMHHPHHQLHEAKSTDIVVGMTMVMVANMKLGRGKSIDYHGI